MVFKAVTLHKCHLYAVSQEEINRHNATFANLYSV